MKHNNFDEPICPAQNIVGNSPKKGQLTYNGRPQGKPFFADTDDELIVIADERKHDLISQYGDFPCFLYIGGVWELKIWD